MKRLHITQRPKRVYIRFFWTQCSRCGDEFKQEYMYKVYQYGYMGRIYYNYRCEECFQNDETTLGLNRRSRSK